MNLPFAANFNSRLRKKRSERSVSGGVVYNLGFKGTDPLNLYSTVTPFISFLSAGDLPGHNRVLYPIHALQNQKESIQYMRSPGWEVRLPLSVHATDVVSNGKRALERAFRSP